MPIPQQGDEVAYLTIVRYADGTMAVDGNVADTGQAVAMLDIALTSAQERHARWVSEQSPLLIPSSATGLPEPRLGLIPFGDRAKGTRVPHPVMRR